MFTFTGYGNEADVCQDPPPLCLDAVEDGNSVASPGSEATEGSSRVESSGFAPTSGDECSSLRSEEHTYGAEQPEIVREAAVDRTVYVLGIDAELTEMDFLAFLRGCGEISRIRVCGDVHNPTVYGFVEFTSRAAAQRLLQQTRRKLGRGLLNLSWAKTQIKDDSSVNVTESVLELIRSGGDSGTTLRNSRLLEPTAAVRAAHRRSRLQSEKRKPAAPAVAHPIPEATAVAAPVVAKVVAQPLVYPQQARPVVYVQSYMPAVVPAAVPAMYAWPQVSPAPVVRMV